MALGCSGCAQPKVRLRSVARSPTSNTVLEALLIVVGRKEAIVVDNGVFSTQWAIILIAALKCFYGGTFLGAALNPNYSRSSILTQ